MNFQQTPPNQSLLKSQTSRRAILRTTAWAAPAVLVASAAPAFATTSGATPADIAVFHTPVMENETVITVTNLGASSVTVTVALPLVDAPDSSGVYGVYPLGWEESAFTGTTWAWSATLLPGESRDLRTIWSAGPVGGSREVIVSVGADEVQTLDIEPPFVVAASRRSSAPELDGGAGEVVMAPNLR